MVAIVIVKEPVVAFVRHCLHQMALMQAGAHKRFKSKIKEIVMTKTKVARVPDISHEEWLDLRRTGIGGSDAATIVGLNPYSSRYSLYLDKIGEVKHE